MLLLLPHSFTQGGGEGFEIIGQFAGSLSASLSVYFGQIFLNLDDIPMSGSISSVSRP